MFSKDMLERATLNIDDLDGKTLEMRVVKNENIKYLIGFDKTTGVTYFLQELIF